jgi:hypothetical protein
VRGAKKCWREGGWGVRGIYMGENPKYLGKKAIRVLHRSPYKKPGWNNSKELVDFADRWSDEHGAAKET